MQLPNIRTTLAAAAVLSASSAFAVLPAVRDYDAPDLVGSSTGFTYAYGEFAPPPPVGVPNTHANLAGIGVGGSAAKRGTIDFSVLSAPPNWSGFGVGDNIGFTVGDVTTSNVGDLIATVDILLGGLDVPSPAGGLSVTFEFQSLTPLFSGTDATTSIARYRFLYPSSLPTTFTTFGGPLSTATLQDNFPGGTENAATRLAQLGQAYQAVVIIEMNLGNIAATAFGLDANNTITIDNLSLAPVPEPSTYAAIVGGLALLGAALLRRRKA